MIESDDLVRALERSVDRRRPLIEQLHAEQTDAYRLLHGVSEDAPGVAIDRYGPVLLVQTWRDVLEPDVLGPLLDTAQTAVGSALHVVWNHRGKPKAPFRTHHAPELPPTPQLREYGLLFDANPRHRGEDPLLFLDLREGRRRVREHEATSVLNLFAYTCGVGVAARAGGATDVWNVDFASSALAVGDDNAAINGLDDGFRTIQQDVFPVIRHLAGQRVGRRGQRDYLRLSPRTFDLVVLDPPRWSRGRFGAVDIVRDYPSLFKPALLCTAESGSLLVTNHSPKVSESEWVDVLTRCAKKAGRPIRDLTLFSPAEDFPSFDGAPPLKLAWVSL